MGEAAARLLFDKIEHKEKKEVVYEESKQISVDMSQQN